MENSINEYKPTVKTENFILEKSGLTNSDLKPNINYEIVNKKIYDYVFKKDLNFFILSNEFIDELIKETVKDEQFLLDPKLFDKKDIYELTKFLTTRFTSKLFTFNDWLTQKEFLTDYQIVVAPTVYPNAHTFIYKKDFFIIIHYGLSQSLEFVSEFNSISSWIKDLKEDTNEVFALGYPLIKKQIDLLLSNKLIISAYAQSKPIFFPAITNYLPTRHWVVALCEVGLAELFICAHEHTHIKLGHYSRNFKENQFVLDPSCIPSLSQEKQIELITDLEALYYFSPDGWGAALHGISQYFFTIGISELYFPKKIEGHPSIFDRIENILMQSVGVGGAYLFSQGANSLYIISQELMKLKKNQSEINNDEYENWANILEDYKLLLSKIVKLLVFGELRSGIKNQ